MRAPFPELLAPNFGELAGRWAAIPEQYKGNAQVMLTLLQQARMLGGSQAMTVTSWYRDPVRNRLAGGASTSQHLTASAVDFKVADPARWVATFRSNAPATYGQLIYYQATSGHIHLSLPNRASGKTGEYLVESSPGKYLVVTSGTGAPSAPAADAEGLASSAARIVTIALAILAALGLIGVLT